MNGSFRLNGLGLFQFKSYTEKRVQFPERIVGFCGSNGIGKTNLLDAIYSLCLTKGYFGRSDAANVQFGKHGFRIEGDFSKNGQSFQIELVLRETGKKELKVNNELYNRFSDHIGKFPVVVIAPDDVILINGGSEDRRKMLDTLMAQMNPAYLQLLIRYNKILQQRNGLLKQISESQRRDDQLLDILDQQLIENGVAIYTFRKDFLAGFLPDVIVGYQRLAQSKEKISLFYSSQLAENNYRDLLKQNRERDIVSARTSIGIHKDDIHFQLHDQPFRQVASQGQRKSILFALKLAEFNALKQHNGFAPLLLLDDVFEKLDEGRMHNLLQWACVENQGQVFLTDTHTKRLQKALTDLDIRFQIENLS